MKNTTYLLPISEDDLTYLLHKLKKKHKQNNEKSYKVEFIELVLNDRDKTHRLLHPKNSLLDLSIRGYSI